MSVQWPDQFDGDVEALAHHVGMVFTSFVRPGHPLHAYGVEVASERWFLKGAIEARAVPSLRRAIALHDVVAHPTVISLRRVVGTASGPVLVYPWVDGDVLSGNIGGAPGRHSPDSAHARFRSLSLPEVNNAFDCILDADLEIVAAGFVAVDLYDGTFIYDFDARQMWVCDLDDYRPGPFVLVEDRLPGSTRFMAPEEFVRGATIDERTTVFNLGRTGLVFLDEREVGEAFRGTSAMAEVLARATRLDPVDRYRSVAELTAAWRAVSGVA